jgi:nucleoside-diphosphate-sugar epimerase
MRTAMEGPWDEVVVFDLAAGLPDSSIMSDVSGVFHLAGKAHAVAEVAQSMQEYTAINTSGTRKLLEIAQAADVKRFVYFSSVKAMGEEAVHTQDEQSECRPTTPYGASKYEAEKLVLHGGYVPEPVVLRLSMVYGPDSKGNLSRMITAIDKSRFPPLPHMNNLRAMVHVEDVVQAAMLAMNSPDASGQTYIVTDGQLYSSRQLYIEICSALGRRVPGWTVPVGLMKLAALVGDVVGKVRGRRFVFDTCAMERLTGSANYSSGKIVGELGFKPVYDLSTALPEIVAGLRDKK